MHTTSAVLAARPRPPRQVAMERALGGAFVGAEKLFVVVSLFMFARALVPLLLEAGGAMGDPGEGNPVLRAIFVGIHVGTFGLVALHWRSVAATLRRSRLTVALVLWAMASVIWSMGPDVTLRRSIALAGTTAFGVYLAARFDTLALFRLLGLALGASAVLSVLFAVALPQYGVDHSIHAGAWQGVFTQKNELGQIMVLAAVVFALLAARAHQRRPIYWLGAALAVGLVLMSTSKTALAVLFACLALAPLLRTVRWHHSLALPLWVFTVLIGGLSAVALVANRDAVFVSLGRDATLTGRTPLWLAVIERIAERPLLGHGYSAFWVGAEGPSAAIWSAVGWRTPHAHNGYLDLALDLGLIGVALFLLGAGIAVVRAIGAVRRIRTAEALWPILLILFVLFYNFAESFILRQNHILWVLYVAAVCSVLLHRAPATGGGGDTEQLAPRRADSDPMPALFPATGVAAPAAASRGSGAALPL